VGGRGGTPYNGLYGDVLSERGTFLGSRYVKGVSFQGKVYARGTFSEKGI